MGVNIQTNGDLLNGVKMEPASFSQGEKSSGRYIGTSSTRQIAAAFVASLGCCCTGINVAYAGVAMPSMKKESELAINEQQGAWIASGISFGAILGSLLSGPVMNRFGRKKCLLHFTILNLFGWLMIIAGLPVLHLFGATEAVLLVIAGRLITGIAMGAGLAVGPVYISEAIIPELRKSVGAFSQTTIVLFALIMVVLGSFLNWFSLAVVCAVILIPAIVSVVYLPESPVWLAAVKQDIGAAHMSLLRLRGSLCDTTEELKSLHNELQSTSSSTSPHGQASNHKILFTKGVRKPMALALGIVFFQQFTAVDILIFVYNIEIYEQIDNRINPYLLSTIIQIVNLLCCFLSMVVIRWFNAKTILVISAIGMCLSLLGLGIFLYSKESEIDLSISWIAITSLFAFVISYGLGYGPFGFSVSAQILPLHARDFGNSVNIVFMCTCAVFVSYTFYDLKSWFNLSGVMFFYAAVTGLCVLFTGLLLPKTNLS